MSTRSFSDKFKSWGGLPFGWDRFQAYHRKSTVFNFPFLCNSFIFSRSLQATSFCSSILTFVLSSWFFLSFYCSWFTSGSLGFWSLLRFLDSSSEILRRAAPSSELRLKIRSSTSDSWPEKFSFRVWFSFFSKAIYDAFYSVEIFSFASSCVAKLLAETYRESAPTTSFWPSISKIPSFTTASTRSTTRLAVSLFFWR